MMRKGVARRTALVALTLSCVLTAALLAATVLPASAQTAAPAQGSPTIKAVELRLWPEYDDPGVLVIVSGQLADGVSFPFQASFPLPAGARNIQATYQDASGSLINRPFEVKDGNLTYELPSAGFHYEYYVDRAPSGDERNIAYQFVAPYAVDALTVAVQQPARATGFALTPAAESSETGQDGLTYHVLNRRNLAAGEKVDIGIRYAKTDTGLSAPQLAVAATGSAGQATTGPAPAAAGGSTGVMSWLPWLLIGLGLALGAAALVYWLVVARPRAAPASASAAKSGAPVKPQPAARGQAVRPAAPARAAPRPEPAAEPVSFCTNCGHGLKAEDRFCSQCGAPRRT